jgi:hypothetical protein
MLIARLESADWHDIHIAVQHGPEINLKMNLLEERSTRAQPHKEVDVGSLVIFTSRYRADRRGVQTVPARDEPPDTRRMHNHDVVYPTNSRCLTAEAQARTGVASWDGQHLQYLDGAHLVVRMTFKDRLH